MAADDTFYKAILDSLYDGVYFVDRERRITYWNRGAERIAGFRAEQVVGRCCRDNILNHVDDHGTALCTALCPVAKTIADGEMREVEISLHHADGRLIPVLAKVTPLRDPAGVVIGGIEVFSDNSALIAARRRVTELGEAANVDQLTGKGNRRFIEAKLTQLLAGSGRRDPGLGVLYIDVDRFKRINDANGHDVGDAVLRMVAGVIGQSLRSTDFVGRWGGDEFVAVLHGVDKARLITIANKLRAAIERSPVSMGRGEIRATVSIGATVARAGDTMATLQKRADQALYYSKSTGRNLVTFSE